MTELFRINLNKGESRASKLERMRERSRWIIFGVLVALFLGLNISLFMYNKKMNTLIADRQSKIAEITQQIRELKQKGMNLSKDDIRSLAKLEENRVFWTAKMQALAKNVARDMALTEIEYRHDRFVVSGITQIYPGEREFDIVNNFTKQLESDPVFSREFGRVKLLSYSRENVRGQDIVQFQIQADLPGKTITRTRTRRTPIIVGGNS